MIGRRGPQLFSLAVFYSLVNPHIFPQKRALVAPSFSSVAICGAQASFDIDDIEQSLTN